MSFNELHGLVVLNVQVFVCDGTRQSDVQHFGTYVLSGVYGNVFESEALGFVYRKGVSQLERYLYVPSGNHLFEILVFDLFPFRFLYFEFVLEPVGFDTHEILGALGNGSQVSVDETVLEILRHHYARSLFQL